jgi:hypothetical protein
VDLQLELRFLDLLRVHFHKNEQAGVPFQTVVLGAGEV